MAHMDTGLLHSPLARRTIEALNNGTVDDFMALFTPDATVIDSATYHGHDEIRRWTERENYGVHMHIDVVRELNDDGTELEINARSQGGYSGPGTFTFTIQGDKIERLVIG
jgi:hypothetical protein